MDFLADNNSTFGFLAGLCLLVAVVVMVFGRDDDDDMDGFV